MASTGGACCGFSCVVSSSAVQTEQRTVALLLYHAWPRFGSAVGRSKANDSVCVLNLSCQVFLYQMSKNLEAMKKSIEKNMCDFHHFPVGLHSSFLESLGVAPKLESGRTANRIDLRSWLVSKLNIFGPASQHALAQVGMGNVSITTCNKVPLIWWTLYSEVLQTFRFVGAGLRVRPWATCQCLDNAFAEMISVSTLLGKRYQHMLRKCHTVIMTTRCVAVFCLALICPSHSTIDARNERFCRLFAICEYAYWGPSSKSIFIAQVSDTLCLWKDLISWQALDCLWELVYNTRTHWNPLPVSAASAKSSAMPVAALSSADCGLQWTVSMWYFHGYGMDPDGPQTYTEAFGTMRQAWFWWHILIGPKWPNMTQC